MYAIELKYKWRETAYITSGYFSLEHDIDGILDMKSTFITEEDALSDASCNIDFIPYTEVFEEDCKYPKKYRNWFKNIDTNKITSKVINLTAMQRRIKLDKIRKDS